MKIGQDMKKRIGEYLLLKQLGQGSFGQVYLAENGQDEKVAIKMIPIPEQNQKMLQQQIEREIGTLKKLKNIEHPNIIRLLGQRQSKNNYYLIMEYCKFGDLQNYIETYFYNDSLKLALLSEQ